MTTNVNSAQQAATGRRVIVVGGGSAGCVMASRLSEAVEHDPRGSANMNIPFTTPPEKPQSSVLPITDLPVLPSLERLRSG